MEKTELKISLTGLLNVIFDGQDNSFPEALEGILNELEGFVDVELRYAKNEGDEDVLASYEKVIRHLTAAKQAIL